MNFITLKRLALGVALSALVVLLSCGEDKGTNGVDDSSNYSLWFYGGNGGVPKVLVLDGESLDPVDSVQFLPYLFEKGFSIPGQNLAVLSWRGGDQVSGRTCVIDPFSLDTIATREDVGDFNGSVSPDGKYLFLGFGNVSVLELPALALVSSLSVPHGWVTYDRKHDRLLARTNCQGDTLLAWNLSEPTSVPSRLNVPAPNDQEIVCIGGLEYIPDNDNLVISCDVIYEGGTKTVLYEADGDDLTYIRDWIGLPSEPAYAYFTGQSKFIRVVDTSPTWTSNSDFRLELVDQNTQAVVGTIPQAEITKYISGAFSAEVRAIQISPDGRWAYVVIPDENDDGSYVYKIDIEAFAIRTVKYLNTAHCSGLMLFEKPVS